MTRMDRLARGASLAVFLTVANLGSVMASADARRTQDLGILFSLEARLLETELDQYEMARESEDEAWKKLQRLATVTDEALAVQSPLAQLRELDRELALAREAATAKSRESGRIRRQILIQLGRLEQLGREIQRRRDRALVATEDIDGFWLIEITDHGSGLLELSLDGTLVSGSYRLDNGAQGSVRGTYANHRLRLDRIDTRYGFESTFEGQHDTETGELSGIWQAREPSDGRAAYGDWTARKVAPGEDRAEP